MKNILFALLLLAPTLSHAVLVTEPPQPGLAPRANARGAGYTPPSVQNVPVKTAQYPKPAYVENGRPVYANEVPKSEKQCRDNYGAVIKYPDNKVINANPKANIFPHR